MEGITLLDSHHTSADSSLEFHHTITTSHNNPVKLASFPEMQDPAVKVGSLVPSVALAF